MPPTTSPPSPPSLPATMPAAVHTGLRQIEVERLPVPAPGPGEALVEISHCGICGSDLHTVIEGWGAPSGVGGHEPSGRIAALGPDVTGWSIGDAVVIGQGPTCGECRACKEGRPSLCSARGRYGEHAWQGSFATYTLVRVGELHRVPEGLDLRTAALTEPLAVALHGITNGAVQPGDRVLVTGTGPIGLLTIAALRAMGVDDITVSEPGEARRQRALAVGARTALTPDALVAPAMPFDVVDEPFDVALECSGRADAMEAALGQLGRGGRLVLVGAGIKPPRFDPNRILMNELVITGAFVYDAGGFERALELLASGQLPTEHLLEPDDVPLSGLLDAMERLARGELAGKVLVAPREETA